MKNDENIYGLSVIVESQEKRNNARLVDARIEKFLWDFATLLAEMRDEDFETMKSSIINQRRSHDIDLESEVNRNWCEMRERKYNFERNEIEARQLEILNKNSLEIFFRENILGERRRKLSVQIIANAGDDDSLLQHGYIHLNLVCDDHTQNIVRDIAKFKQLLEPFTR
jgi:secreted Zn-dependent insulinase-like peptidase